MTQRLPTPGGDEGDWGTILNDYLAVSLNTDGTLNAGVVGTAQLQSNAITNAQLDIPTQTSLATAASAYVKPSSGIPSSDLSSALQSAISNANNALQAGAAAGGDLSGNLPNPTVAALNGVSLPAGAPSAGQVLQATGPTGSNWATVSSTTVSDATTSAKGLIELAGDISGNAAAPQVVATHLSAALPLNQGGTGSVTQNFVDISSNQTIAGTKTFSSPLSANISGNAATATTASSATTAMSVTTVPALSGDVTTSGSSNATTVAKLNGVSLPSTAPGAGQVLQATGASSSAWATVSATASDATNSTKGVVELTGDLAGSASSPQVVATHLSAALPLAQGGTGSSSQNFVDITTTQTIAGSKTFSSPITASITGNAATATSATTAMSVTTVPALSGDVTTSGSSNATTVAKLNGVSLPGSAPSAGQALVATGSASSAWSTISGGATNATSTSAGIVQLSGDLGGSATAPIVARVNGITLPSSAPVSGNVLTANSSNTTTWSTPAAGVTLDSANSDIQPLGSSSAGTVSQAAKADHIHSMPTLNQVGVPTASVSLNTHKITGLANGAAATDAAAYGQLPLYAGVGGTATTVSHPGGINVLDYGAVGDGVTDDAPAIQAAINAANAGGTVIIPRTASFYAIGSTLVVPSGITVRGLNGRVGSGTITMISGANLDACIASNAWYNNGGGIDGYISIHDLTINANGSNQSAGLGHCIALSSWRSRVTNCVLQNGIGNGIYFGTTTKNGTTTASGTCIESHFNDNIISNNTTYGIGTLGTNVTDNWYTDNIILGSTSGIHQANGAGDKISGNHIYTCGSGINLNNTSLCVIANNYIENSNAAASTGNCYQIKLNPVGDGIVIAGNHLDLSLTAQSGNNYFGIYVLFSSNCQAFSISGNVIGGNTTTPVGTAIYLDKHTATYALASLSGNSTTPGGFSATITNNGPVTLSSSPSYTTTLATTATSGFARLPASAGPPTGTPLDTTSGIPLIVDTVNNALWFYAGSAWHEIT